MQHFAESRFWRAIAVAMTVGVFYLGWAISGERTVIPVAHAGGVVMAPGGAICTSNDAGDVLYIWNASSFPGMVDRWSFATGMVTRQAVNRIEGPLGPGAPVPAQPFPGGQPRGPGQGQGGGDGGWERPK